MKWPYKINLNLKHQRSRRRYWSSVRDTERHTNESTNWRYSDTAVEGKCSNRVDGVKTLVVNIWRNRNFGPDTRMRALTGDTAIRRSKGGVRIVLTVSRRWCKTFDALEISAPIQHSTIEFYTVIKLITCCYYTCRPISQTVTFSKPQITFRSRVA